MKYSDGHIHIAMSELDAIAGFDADALSEEQLTAVLQMEEKISSCPVCMERYRFFMESEMALHTMEHLAPSGLSALAQVLTEQLSALDEQLRGAVSRWLDSSQTVLQSLTGTTLRPAAAGAFRGVGQQAEPEIIPVPAGEGSFRFVLEKASEVVFRIPRTTEDGAPVCLLIQGVDGTDFTGVYPLTGLELPGFASPLLDSPKIALAPGAYVLTVPTMAV